MKKEKIKKIRPDAKRLKIVFINENDNTTAMIVNPPPNFIIPRIGEHFELHKNDRTNVVTSLYHSLWENEVIIWYDWFFCHENKTLQEKDMSQYKGKIPR